MTDDELMCPRCGELTPGNPDPEAPEYAEDICDPCAESDLDEEG